MACLKIASGIKNFDDIGMRQAVGQFGFPDEAFDENRIVILIETVLHQFQGALLLEQQMFCKVDFSHTAPSQQTDDTVFVKEVTILKHLLLFGDHHKVTDGRPGSRQLGKPVILYLCTALGTGIFTVPQHGKGDLEF